MSFTLTFGQDGNCATAEVVWSVDGKTYNFRSDNNFVAWISTIFTVADVVNGGGGDLLISSDQLPPVQGGVGNLWAEYGVGASVVGNARGEGAVDWQQFRVLTSQVASGDYATVGGGITNTASSNYATVGGGEGNSASGDNATVGGGYNNTASATYATVGGGESNSASIRATVGGGFDNTASGTYATVGGGINNSAQNGCATVSGGRQNTASSQYATIAGGFRGLADRYGMVAHASGQFSAQGDAQAVEFVARNTTVNATSSVLFLDGSSTRFTVTNNSVLSGILTISGFSTTGAKVGLYQRSISINNVAGTTTLVHVSTISTDHEDDATWSVTITADNATDSLNIACLGSAGDDVRWVAVFRGLQILMP
jgi:hypothetical protein